MAQQQRPLLVDGAHLVDPASGLDGPGHLLVEGGRVAAVGEGPAPDELRGRDGVEVVDAGGKYLVPGLIDIHVHLREPGQEDKEDIASGSAAAAAGGFTTVVAMPNTTPAIDTASAVRLVIDRAAEAGLCRVLPSGAITRGLGGEEMVEYADLVAAGAVAFTDDGRPVMDGGLMRRAMAYSNMLGVPMITHAEDLNLSANGAMHEGRWSTRLGLRGIPYAAEVTAIARDIELARITGAHLHVAHVSCAQGVELVRRAKSDGLRVTAETAPHFLWFTDSDCAGYDPNFKMNPPLRTQADQESLVGALEDGTIDVIATDHAPHSPTDKDAPFAQAPMGVIGLETSFAACHDRLVRRGPLDLPRLVELMSAAPARILNGPWGTLAEGAPADLALLDADEAWVPRASDLRGKSRNCPWLGRSLTGRVRGTWLGGVRTHSPEAAAASS